MFADTGHCLDITISFAQKRKGVMMDDLIDRQSALDIIKKCYDGISDPFIAGTVCYGEVKALLPEPHIRCKDCKYYRPMTDQDDLCVYREMQVFPDDYCSRAEGREDG